MSALPLAARRPGAAPGGSRISRIRGCPPGGTRGIGQECPDPDRWWWLEFSDRDLAFDDYAGWMASDQWTFQQLADCGQATWVLTDADMAEYETRVRFVELEVESW